VGLDGSDGSVIWRYQAKIDTERAEGTFYNRTTAVWPLPTVKSTSAPSTAA